MPPYQVTFSSQILKGLLLAFASGLLLHLLLLLISWLLKKLLHMDPLERASIIYSNAGNLVFPLVTSIFGSEWLIYSTAFTTVQRFLLWSHGKNMLCGEKKMDWKKVLLNVNLITCALGLLCFLCNIHFPSVVGDAIDSIGAMIGPSAMLVTGMLIGGMDLKQVFSFRRAYLVAAFRLIAVPFILILIIRVSGLCSLVDNGETILLISCMAVMTPSASTVTQMAQVYGQNAGYASAINVITTACCILTMPLMVYWYQLL